MMLTDGSVALAKHFHVPEFIVGLTVMAVGTSMPELAVSFISAIGGHGDMAIGNVVGSNIFNIFAVLGTCSIVSPIIFTKTNIRRDIPLCIVVSVGLLLVTAFDHTITRLEGIALLLSYILMIWFTIRSDKRHAESKADNEEVKTMPTWRIPIWIILGLAGLIFGGEIFVDAASQVARKWGVSEATIAITMLAGGTSLPELASSLVSLAKGSQSLALGNVLGSNIANILLILGVSSSVTPLTMGDITMFDIYVTVSTAFAVLLTAFIIGRNKLTRIEGVLFLLCYAAYIYTLV